MEIELVFDIRVGVCVLCVAVLWLIDILLCVFDVSCVVVEDKVKRY